jgi:elongation factor Ts
MNATISAKEVMTLRQKTGLSMMECKKALMETNGDMNAAEDALRIKMKGKMDTRTDRAAGEGRIAIKVAPDGKSAVICELRAETDFTAKNEEFGDATSKIASLALAATAGDVTPNAEMNALVDQLRIKTGENISIARIRKINGGPTSSFGTYVHHDGKTGVVLHCEGKVSPETARDICMHITAAVPRPEGVTRDDVPKEVIERERKLAIALAIEEGKPEQIAQKIVEGKINKLYADLALVEQPFVKDPNVKIKDLLGKDGQVVAFLRWQVGQG